MKKGRYSEAEEKIIRKLTVEGKKRKEIAEIIGRKPNSVRQFCCSHAIPKYNFWDSEKIQKVIKDYQNGKSTKEIASEFNYSQQKIRSILHDAGVETPLRPFVWTDKMQKELDGCVLNYNSLSKIAQAMGKTEDSIRNRMVVAYGTILIDKARKEIY